LTPTRRLANPLAVRRAVIGFALLALVAGAFTLGYVLGAHADDRHVPNLLGLGTEDGGQAAARRALAAADLRVGKVASIVCDTDERGLVVRQNPPPGAMVPAGATVNIGIGGGGIGLFSGDPPPCLPGEQTPAGAR
jgi:beta-lactam-binding protein with PASTA domain